MKKRLLPFAAWLMVMTVGTAHAVVLTNGEPAQKFRKDVGKQLSKYALCLIKQLRKCEASGASSGPECFLVPTVQAVPPADAKGKFVAGVALCESKVDLSKKSPSGDPVTDYESIGCPGDSDSGTSGDQRYTDLTAYQAGTIATLKATIGAQAALIDILGCASGSNHADEADIDCVAAQAQKVGVLVKGLFKCGLKCENDYKNLFGNGGGTDSPVCADGGDPNFQICLDAVIAKATKKGPFDPGVQTFVDGTLAPALTDAGNDIYNQDDCGP